MTTEAPKSRPSMTSLPPTAAETRADPLHVTITCASSFELIALRDWIVSGEMGRALWAWMSRNGYRV